jgi:hypothetical protein
MREVEAPREDEGNVFHGNKSDCFQRKTNIWHHKPLLLANQQKRNAPRKHRADLQDQLVSKVPNVLLPLLRKVNAKIAKIATGDQNCKDVIILKQFLF